MGDLRMNEISYSGSGTGVLMLNGINYTGVPQYTELTTSGSVCAFKSDAVVPIKKGTFNIDSSASSINVTVQGPNFFNEDTELGRINDTTGLPTSQTDVFRSKTFSPCIGGATYYVHVGCNKNIRVYWYDSANVFISVTNDICNASVTAPANAAYLKIRSTTTYGTVYLGDISINLTVNDHEYHPYVSPVTQTINLGSTRTGGSATVRFDGSCFYDDGNGNTTELTPISPIMQVYGSTLIYCNTGDSEVTYHEVIHKVDYIESWIIKSASSVAVPTIVAHTVYTDGQPSSFDVKQQEGNTSLSNGDITTYIGSDSNWLWKVTATAAMTYRLFNVNTGVLGNLQTAAVNDVIIDDGDLTTYCMEIRRYS